MIIIHRKIELSAAASIFADDAAGIALHCHRVSRTQIEAGFAIISPSTFNIKARVITSISSSRKSFTDLLLPIWPLGQRAFRPVEGFGLPRVT